MNRALDSSDEDKEKDSLRRRWDIKTIELVERTNMIREELNEVRLDLKEFRGQVADKLEKIQEKQQSLGEARIRYDLIITIAAFILVMILSHVVEKIF